MKIDNQNGNVLVCRPGFLQALACSRKHPLSPSAPRSWISVGAARRASHDKLHIGLSSGAPPSTSAVDAAHAEVFDLEELLDAVVRALAPDAALLHAAER